MTEKCCDCTKISRSTGKAGQDVLAYGVGGLRASVGSHEFAKVVQFITEEQCKDSSEMSVPALGIVIAPVATFAEPSIAPLKLEITARATASL